MGNQLDKSTLDAAFADNTTGDITPSMLRDLVETTRPSRGTLQYDSAATAIAVIGTAEVVGNDTTLDAELRFSMPQGNRLTYDGDADVSAQLVAAVGVSVAAAAQVVGVGIAVNGVVVADTVQRQLMATAGALYQFVVLADVDLEEGDYVELAVVNDTSAAAVTIDHGQLRAAAFLT